MPPPGMKEESQPKYTGWDLAYSHARQYMLYIYSCAINHINIANTYTNKIGTQHILLLRAFFK